MTIEASRLAKYRRPVFNCIFINLAFPVLYSGCALMNSHAMSVIDMKQTRSVHLKAVMNKYISL